MPGIYGVPSPFSFSLISLKVVQFVTGKVRKKIINIFLNIRSI